MLLGEHGIRIRGASYLILMFNGIVFCEPDVPCSTGVKFLSVRQMEIYKT